jgi:hypothetical protein
MGKAADQRLGGPEAWLRMEGKERSGDVFTGSRGFLVRGVKVVVS